MDVRIKRVYAAPAASDGLRVLVDRLWPRGLTRERAAIDLQCAAVAPSTALRRSWHADPLAHSPARFAAFAADYRAELAIGVASQALDGLIALAREHDRVSLVYGAKDERVNHAVVLLQALTERAALDPGAATSTSSDTSTSTSTT
ncbi:uncharacterized protein YeaO (DUF488 family) [Leucobacter exalbidus]|uniref:Uncharacterized protein YeaO (DUF488 family) n=1 Tax=Leucobacter exalbidus TaxID=662960 RepID=A0A940PT71_9MICO|nr:DUF488 family protein [Leucobacter exalbidus]MBP1324786.1 uncharacterized protein YeaO (DUF488 family) [Leucobacter exalbidus]